MIKRKTIIIVAVIAVVLIAAAVLMVWRPADSLASHLPEFPWETADWVRCEADDKSINDQGTFVPEEMRELLKTAVLTDTPLETGPEFDCYILYISNPESQPLQRYNIEINELGTVHVEIQTANGIVFEQYYQTSDKVFRALDEMLLGTLE